MRLPSLKEAIAGVAVGSIDVGANEIDEKQGYSKPFENVTDLYHVGLVLGGMAYYSMKGDPYGLVIFDNGMPLLTKSIIYAAGSMMGKKLAGPPTADPVNPTYAPSQARPIVKPAIVSAAPSVSLVNRTY